MKVAICDDDKRIRDILAGYVREVSQKVEVEMYSDAQGILASDFDADILLLDIQMPGMDGMSAAGVLRDNAKDLIIIFVTALEDYVFKAFDVEAFQYIVKPFDEDKVKSVLSKAIDRVHEKLKGNSNKGNPAEQIFTIKSKGSNINVVISQITYAEIFDRKIILHLKDQRRMEYYGRMSELERILGADFFRVHRAYLINLSCVGAYDSKNVCIDGEEIPLARGKYRDLIKAYLAFHTRGWNEGDSL